MKRKTKQKLSALLLISSAVLLIAAVICRHYPRLLKISLPVPSSKIYKVHADLYGFDIPFPSFLMEQGTQYNWGRLINQSYMTENGTNFSFQRMLLNFVQPIQMDEKTLDYGEGKGNS